MSFRLVTKPSLESESDTFENLNIYELHQIIGMYISTEQEKSLMYELSMGDEMIFPLERRSFLEILIKVENMIKE